jgi:tetratricopeptide (TPR) repeat protein
MASKRASAAIAGQSTHPNVRAARTKRAQQPILESLTSGWRPFALLAVAALLVYSKTVGFEWVNFDDRVFAENYYMQHWADVGRAWFGSIFGDFYRPVYFTMIVAENILFGGNNTAAHHGISLVIHIVNCGLVFVLLAQFSGDRLLSLLLALLFAVHPLLTQATGWVPGRNDSLMAVFVLSAMITLLAYTTTRSRWHLALHGVWFVMAVFTKETALVVPAIAIVYLLTKNEDERLPVPSLLLFGAVWLAAAVLYFAMRSHALQGVSSSVNPFVSILSTWRALPEMLGKMLIPIGLAVHPTYTLANTIIGFIVLLCLGASVLLLQGTRRTPAVAGVVWLVVFLVPPMVYYLDRVQATGVDFKYLEHRGYLPMVGFLLVLAMLTQELMARRVLQRSVAVAIFACCVVAGGVVANVHLECFRNAYNFWGNVLETNRTSVKAYTNIGSILYDVNRPEEAAAYFRKAIELDPKSVAAWDGLGSMFIRMNMFDEAERNINHAYSLDSTFPNVLYNKAFLTHRQNPNDSATTAAAIALYEKTIKYAPAHGQAYLSLVYFASREGRLADVRKYFNQAAKHGVDTTILRLEIEKHLRGTTTAW